MEASRSALLAMDRYGSKAIRSSLKGPSVRLAPCLTPSIHQPLNHHRQHKYRSMHNTISNTGETFKNHKWCNDGASMERNGLEMYNTLSSTTEMIDGHAKKDEPNHMNSQSQTPTKGIACYTCGPTVYAPAHLGHARTYVWLDILRRCLEHNHHRTSIQKNSIPTPPPLFVVNITDVDDKILATAAESKESPLSLARRYEAEFWEDWDALNCLRPHVVTRVTEYVDSDIVPYITRLVDQSMAYIIDENVDVDGVYFDVKSFEDKMGAMTRYGKLAPSSSSSDFFEVQRPSYLDETSPGTEPSKDDFKKDSRDFVLWKKRKDGEQMYWDSPWGAGRPGWHIECSAMIEAVQQQYQDSHTFTMHAGGIDLKFPHHTNEIAQAEAYQWNKNVTQPLEWIRHWVHTGHLHIDGMKMSKSLKNFVTIKELLANGSVDDSDDGATSLSSPADDFRLWCLGLSGSYRGNATYSADRIRESRNVRRKIVRFLVEGEEWMEQQQQYQQEVSVASDLRGVKNWKAEDFELFATVQNAAADCRNSLQSDLDGAAFVKGLVRISEAGRLCISDENWREKPVEPVKAAVRTVREFLQLVGFTSSTTRAGLFMDGSSERSRIVGGERALLDEVTKFRSEVRRNAIEDSKLRKQSGQQQSENVKRILDLCDASRDKIFPSLGIEFLDRGTSNELSESDPTDQWRYCIPQSMQKSQPAEAPKAKSRIPAYNVPLKEYFCSGQYEGLYADFDEDGMPRRYHDGTSITKTHMKKLVKKYEKHKKVLNRRDGSTCKE